MISTSTNWLPLDQGCIVRTHRKNTWVSGIFWVLGVTIAYVPARFLYGYIPDTYLPKYHTYFMGTASVGIHQLQYGELLLRFQPLFGLVADDCGTGLLIAVPLPSSTGARVDVSFTTSDEVDMMLCKYDTPVCNSVSSNEISSLLFVKSPEEEYYNTALLLTHVIIAINEG